jgi:fatty acid desaturase
MAETKLSDEVVGESPEQLREQALRQIKKRRDFHAHAFAYVVVNLLLWGVWAVIAGTSDSWYPWPLWVTLGWGIGLVFNAWDVYLRRPISENEIRREMDRLAHGP